MIWYFKFLAHYFHYLVYILPNKNIHSNFGLTLNIVILSFSLVSSIMVEEIEKQQVQFFIFLHIALSFLFFFLFCNILCWMYDWIWKLNEIFWFLDFRRQTVSNGLLENFTKIQTISRKTVGFHENMWDFTNIAMIIICRIARK